MMTCSVHGNSGHSPLMQVRPHVWEARVTIHAAGTYETGTIWTADGRALDFVMASPQVFFAGGILFLTIFDGDEGLSAELRRELMALAA